MIWNPLKYFSQSFLGIDIGTSSIKVVEISRLGGRLKLENYGALKAPSFYKKPFRTFEKSTLLLSTKDIAKAISAILQEAKIKSKKVIFSIPDFSSFFTWFTLPSMSRQEVPTAVRYEARQHIPLPLSEVVLDWQIIEDGLSGQKKSSTMKILLVAVPNEIINQYKRIAELCQLEIYAVEAEVFALSRSTAKNASKVIAVIDIGAQSTTISIIDNKILKRSHSFDTSGNEMTAIISKSLSIDYARAEELKKKYGLNPIPQFLKSDVPYGQDLREVLTPLIDVIAVETEKILRDFYPSQTEKVSKFILAGSSALLPGLTDYFSKRLDTLAEIAEPFADIFYPPILEQTLRALGPSFAIAIGAALRGLE